jgi:YebC/PmpR family DNA-binding regulatory protein
MAGHSKWANIKHRKAAQDARRGKLFTKLIREITVSARVGGADIDSNPRLRTAVNKALAANMTRDTVERAIKRGAGAGDSDNYEEIRYEGYAPGGVAVMVDCLSDNRNRTVSEVRHAFSKTGGNLGTDGSVAYLFNNRGIISFAAGSDEEAIMDAALEAGAEDVVSNSDGTLEVWTAPEQFEVVSQALQEAGLAPQSAEVTMLADTEVQVSLDDAEQVVRLVDMLEDLDDVQNVYTNADFSDEVLANLS